ncbi:MAG: glucosaminidase domain-containing protein [Bacteroidota bacterium]
MNFLTRLIGSFLEAFLTILFLFVMAYCAVYFYQDRKNQLAALPVMEILTDNYQLEWAEAAAVAGTLAEQLLQLKRATYEQIRNEGPVIIGEELAIPVLWQRELVVAKLDEQGWSKGKLRTANAYLDYIDRYLDAAVQDMYQTGVSASITLAQGILESDAGRSKLALTTNNHFGIKARPTASGRRKIKAKQYRQIVDSDFSYRSPAVGVSQHHDDHKYDRFEVYSTVLDSYRRHSQLLLNDCRKARKGCYAWIWSAYPVQRARVDVREMAQRFAGVSGYAPEDFFGSTQLPYYAAQAAGLKMAGYATSKTYHKKLVYIIETYELWRIDIALQQALVQLKQPS